MLHKFVRLVIGCIDDCMLIFRLFFWLNHSTMSYINPPNVRIMRILSIMTAVPTSMPSILCGSFLQINAAIGAQMSPPAFRRFKIYNEGEEDTNDYDLLNRNLTYLMSSFPNPMLEKQLTKHLGHLFLIISCLWARFWGSK